MTNNPRIYLSPPHLGGEESRFVSEAFESNWIAPLGPHVDAFESEFAERVGARHAVAVSSGTAAIHLALRLSDVGPGDTVFVSTFTFIASVNPALYLGARPVFFDSERTSWNLDPDLLEHALARAARARSLPKAVILVHLYGQSADVDAIQGMCARHGVTLIEDAAEALGATYRGRSTGTHGRFGAFSFNGNKIITTSGGGMLICDDAAAATQARKLATQARDPAPYYEHSIVGYNYRLSNVLAAVGRGQLRYLTQRVEARRAHFARYRSTLAGVPGLTFMPEASWGRATRWLTCVLVDAGEFGGTRDEIIAALAEANIESRPLWKPMHLQPVFAGCDVEGGDVAADLFARGLCLPSGSALTASEIDRICAVVAHASRSTVA